jgi:hypothetical protein
VLKYAQWGQIVKQIKTFKIACETKDFLDWHNITEFQGGLKIRDEADIEKAKTSILKYGWSFPFFVWVSGKTNYCLDGHARLLVLKQLEEEGYLIPELPVVYISAKNRAEAKQKLLRLNSNFGHLTKESVLEFAEDIDLNFDEIALPDSVIDFSDSEEDLMGGGNSQLDGRYTMKIETPVYEIKGECPNLSECYETTKTDELLAEIENADIPEDVKQFLRLASYRHTRINFTKVAEYYAHAPKEVQELMENNALVIIDFNKAIEKGFVEMSKGIDQLRQEAPDYE